MTVGAHAVVWGSAMSGCQLWVLVGAPVYSQSVEQPTGVIDIEENPAHNRVYWVD